MPSASVTDRSDERQPTEAGQSAGASGPHEKFFKDEVTTLDVQTLHIGVHDDGKHPEASG